MHSTTYSNLKAELDELKLQVGTPMVSSSAYSNVITAWWQADGPVLILPSSWGA